MRRILLWVITAMLVLGGGAAPAFAAYPVVDAVQGLPYPELVTVYPDDADPDLFYFVPTTVSLVFDNNGKPLLGVQYWGLTGADQNGAGAALTFSVKPSYDKTKIDAVADGLKKTHPNARFAFPALVSSQVDLILNGQFAQDKQDTTAATIKGGTVDGTAAFTAGLNRVGAAAFAQGVAPDSNVLGARYRFTFTGVAKRLYAKITIFDKRVYDHFSVSGGASYFGWASSTWSADWQKLIADGAIKIEILQGGETDTDAYMIEIFKAIVDAKLNGTGMFKPELQPSAIGGGGGGGGGLFGWSFNANTSWQHLDEEHNLVITIDKKKLEDREFQVGLSFATVCARYPDNFVDLTTLANKCIDPVLYKATAQAAQACIAAKQARLDALLANKTLTAAEWNDATEKANNRPCYSAGPAVQPAAVDLLKSSSAIPQPGLASLRSTVARIPGSVSPALIDAMKVPPTASPKQ